MVTYHGYCIEFGQHSLRCVVKNSGAILVEVIVNDSELPFLGAAACFSPSFLQDSYVEDGPWGSTTAQNSPHRQIVAPPE